MSALGIDGAIHYGEGENPLKQSKKRYQTQTTYGEEAGVGTGRRVLHHRSNFAATCERYFNPASHKNITSYVTTNNTGQKSLLTDVLFQGF